MFTRYVLMIVVIILLTGGCTNQKTSLPSQLGDLKLVKMVEGEAATQIIHEMHHKSLGATAHVIGYYGNADSQNILYVSIFEDTESAKQDLMAMAMKMATGTPVFSPLIFDEMGENVRFHTEGMGLVHYFYRVDQLLIWWQVEPENAETTYQDLQDFEFGGIL